MKKPYDALVIILISILSIVTTSVFAGDYPTRPITLIVPMAPGGGSDILGRAFASVAKKFLEQPIVAVNKPGAAGMIGGQAGAQAAPDGYTLTVNSTSITCAIGWEIVNGRTPPFLPKDFASIVSLNMSPALIIVPFDSPWQKVADLVNDARTRPGHYAFCSGGLYGSSHIPAELFTRALGLKFRHVPYTGGGPCISSVVGKHVDFSTQYPSSTIPLVRGNKLKILAIQGDKRLNSMPDIPTVKELGIDAEWYQCIAIAAPQKTPMPIIQKLREVAKKVVEDESYTKVVENMGDEVRFLIGDDMAKNWENESEKVKKLMAAFVEEASKK
jgi:tripartite-type tricarboxylate transporter receptor subunit TctC